MAYRNDLVLKEKGANTDPLTNSAHHSKPFFNRKKTEQEGVVSKIGQKKLIIKKSQRDTSNILISNL